MSRAKDLLFSLVPRAQCFCFYETRQRCAWSSDGGDDFEIDEAIAELPRELIAEETSTTGFVRHTLPSGRTILVLPFSGPESLFVVVFSRNAGKSSWFNPGMIVGLLAPAQGVIEALMSTQLHVERQQDLLTDVENELRLVYKMDEKIHSTSRRHAGLAELVGQSGRFLNACYSVLLIPTKRIRISATHSSWRGVNRKVLDRYLVEEILPSIADRRSPMVLEMSDGPGDGGYQSLICPLVDRAGNVQGVLAQLGRIDNTPFLRGHRRFMAHIVRKVEYVIEQSFDAMTGLMNRAGFEAQLREASNTLSDAYETHQVIYLDLDNLQLVNDTFGREAGDAVIMRFARMLEDDLPQSAVVSRLTGDDFCVLMTHADDAAAMQFAQRLRRRGESLRYLRGDKSLAVTISIGISAFNRAPGDNVKALTSARMACEAAKDHGRDRIEVYNLSNESLIQRRDDMQLIADIQQALDHGGFELLAQPIVAIDSGERSPRYEILLRMRGSDGELVPNSSFFSAAERYQITPQIDRWVVSATLRTLSEHIDALAHSNALFSLNLSGQSLGDDDLLRFIEEEIAATGVPPTNLGFEVTESAAVSNLAKAQSFLEALHDKGCVIALDDFGAGLSSFAYLKNFHVDTLKIDGSFIRDITENTVSESMVAAITQVAKVMRLDTVAEFVESEEVCDHLRDLHVDYAQGHVFGLPESLQTVLHKLNSDAVQSAG